MYTIHRQRHHDASACGGSPILKPILLTLALEWIQEMFSKPCTQVAWAIGRICTTIECLTYCMRPGLAAQRSRWVLWVVVDLKVAGVTKDACKHYLPPCSLTRSETGLMARPPLTMTPAAWKGAVRSGSPGTSGPPPRAYQCHSQVHFITSSAGGGADAVSEDPVHDSVILYRSIDLPISLSA